MKLYLSGPMTGHPDNNFPAFHSAAEQLRQVGYEVISPAEISVERGSLQDHEYYDRCLRADIKAMMECDAIALMDGWEASKGANLELHIAHRVGMQIRFATELMYSHTL